MITLKNESLSDRLKRIEGGMSTLAGKIDAGTATAEERRQYKQLLDAHRQVTTEINIGRNHGFHRR